MRHYHKNKYIKKLNLFSKDAVKSLDTSGARYDTFTWNNIRDLGLYGDCKMKIGSLDFDTQANADVDIPAPVPPDDLVVHYKFDGNFLDSSGYDYHILENEGNVPIDTADYKKGTGSVDFDMTLTRGLWVDKASISQSRISPHVYQNPNGMTISFWVKLRSRGNTGYGRFFEAKDTNAASNSYGIAIGSGGEGELRLYVNNASLNLITFNAPSYNKWVHLTWVLIPNNTNWLAAEHTWKLYLDGVLINTYNNQLYPDWTTDWDMVLGKWAAGISFGDEREMDGNLDDFRIYDRALSSDEVNRIMAEIQKDPVVHFKFENNLVDVTGNLGDLTGNNTSFTTTSKRGDYALQLNYSSYATLPSFTFGDLAPNAFTISFWFFAENLDNGSLPSRWNRFFSFGNDQIDTGTSRLQFFMSRYSDDIDTLCIRVMNSPTIYSEYKTSGTGNIFVGKWTHYTISMEKGSVISGDRYNAIWKLYVNGIEKTFIKTGANNMEYPLLDEVRANSYINQDNYGSSQGWNAIYDDFRIYDKALDANEIREVMWADRGLYMWYKFEPVINNFVANDDLLLHYTFDNDNTDSTGNTVATLASGSAATYSTDRKRGTHSITANSSEKYHLTKNGTPNVLTGLSAFSVCFWVKFESGVVVQHIVRQDNNLLIRTYTGNITEIYVNNDDNFSRKKNYDWDVTLAQNRDRWMLWCFTVDLPTDTIKFFIDNVEQTAIATGAPIDFTVMPSTTEDFAFLNNDSFIQGLRGKLDDFRIYSKVLTEDEIQSLYSRYLTFRDGMYNTIMTDEYSGFDVSTVKKQGDYSLDLSSGVRGGSITLTDGDVNLFQNLQRISFCTWVYLTSFNEFMFVFHQDSVLSVYLEYSTFRINVLLGAGQLMYWQLSLEEISNNYYNKWKHVTIVIDFSETDPLQKVLLYIDGVSKGAGTMSGFTTLTAYPSTTNKFYVGSYDGNNIGFNGYIDDLRVYTFQVEPDDIALIMADTETKYTSIYNIKCNEVYDTYESNSKKPTIYHNRGVLRNKHIINPYFKVNTPLNSLSLNITHFVDGSFEPLGLEPEDQFMITLLVQEDDKKETAEGNRIEYYHRNPQFRIKY